jgi:hypothetical protein
MSVHPGNKNFNLLEVLIIILIALWLCLVLYNYLYYHDEHLLPFQAARTFSTDILLFLIVAAVALGAGGRLFSLVGVRFDRFGEEILFASALGFAVMSYAMMLFGFLGLLYWWAACALLIALFLFSVPKIKHYLEPLLTKSRDEIKTLWSKPLTAFLLLIILFQLLMNIGDCLTPPYEWDTLSYNLGCQNLYVKAHRFLHLPFIQQSYLTCGVELIYALGLLLNSDTFAQILHCYFGFLTLLAIYLFAKRYFSGKVGIVAALIFYTCPVIVWFSGVGKSDLGSDFYTFLTVFAFLRWRLGQDDSQREARVRRQGWLLLSAVLCGIAIHVSYRGLLLLSALLLYLLFVLLADRKERLRARLAAIALFAFLPLAIASPWLIRNAVLTGGNPVDPYFRNRFNSSKAHYFDSLIKELKQKHVSVSQAATKPSAATKAFRWSSLKRRLYFISLPFWDFTIRGRNYDFLRFNGKVTPLYLCLVPLLILCRRMRLTRILLALALIYIIQNQLMEVQHLRYLSPVYAFLALLSSYVVFEGFKPFRRGGAVQTFLLVVVITVAASLLWINFLFFYRAQNISYVLQLENRDEFLARRSNSYYCLAYANNYLPEDSKLFLLADERIYYSYFPAIPITAWRFVELMRAYDFDVEQLHRLLCSLGVTHLLYNPFFHRRFEQNKQISDTLDAILEEYKAAHLTLIVEKSGVELYKLHD